MQLLPRMYSELPVVREDMGPLLGFGLNKNMTIGTFVFSRAYTMSQQLSIVTSKPTAGPFTPAKRILLKNTKHLINSLKPRKKKHSSCTYTIYIPNT